MIKTTVGRTYNLGNYENIYIEIVQDGDSGADPQRLLKEAEQEVKKFFESYKNPKLETKGGLVETEFQRVLEYPKFGFTDDQKKNILSKNYILHFLSNKGNIFLSLCTFLQQFP